MDSSAYRYLIRDLLQKHDEGFSILPASFLTPPVVPDQDAFSNLVLFLTTISANRKENTALPLPRISTASETFFSRLFLSAHHALSEIAAGADPTDHRFARSGSQLLEFLCFCAQGDEVDIVDRLDISAAAMYAFFLEGCMYSGWCPSSREGVAKRTAHAYFIALRKGLSCLDTASRAAILGYLWGTWLFAQKTEGIHDTSISARPHAIAAFSWRLDDVTHSFVGRHLTKPRVFYLLERSSTHVPHPISRLSSDRSVGLTLYANREKINAVILQESSEIDRPARKGAKLVYTCRTASVEAIEWTAAYFAVENTIYRIDLISLPPTTAPVEVSGEFLFENEQDLQEQNVDCYSASGPINLIIRFIKNPLKFHLRMTSKTPHATFSSAGVSISGDSSFEMVTAWARGKGITSIYETKLLGIYD